MGFYPQHQPGDNAALSDSTSGIQLGDSFISPESVQLVNFITLGTIAAASFPTGTTIGDDVTNGLAITIDGTELFIPLLSTIS